MGTSRVNITLGTAGHIDHGKTALIKCLTGCDTDRLKAEKERGMSIELGFAPCTIGEMEVGIVDVPGHENFIKTMVAGATGIDGVIFVIAADDGVMPQTREHLDILTLLGVRDGVVALTKADCVQPERLKNVTSEIRDFLAGTFLENAPVLAVSSITGQGFENFYEALKELVGAIKPKQADGIFRMPVERAFSLKGYGTVVTGIPVSGRAKIGDELTLLPKGDKGRLKAIQVYKRNSETALCGQCAALNVAQWDHKDIKRGNVVTIGEYFLPHTWYLCQLHMLAAGSSKVKNGAGVKFHTGTSEVTATVHLMEGSSVAAGDHCLAQFKLSQPVVAGPGDRFIVRSLSPVRTIGGGMIVEPTAKKLKRRQPDTLQDARKRAEAVRVQKDFVEYCVRTAQNHAASEAQISLRVKMPSPQLKQILSELTDEGKILNLTSKLYIHMDTFGEVGQRLLGAVGNFHRSRPESPGMTADQLCQAAGLEKDVVDGLIRLLTSQKELVERKKRLALPAHCETFTDDEQKLLETVEALYRDRPFSPPKAAEVTEQTGAAPQEVDRILRILTELERLVKVENDLLFHAEAIEQARQRLISFIQKEGRLESVKFKYLLDTTRKFAIPLLDYFDRTGLLRRVGNTRYLKEVD